MYFTVQQIVSSIGALSKVHPFHGITFLACKAAKLPVGSNIVFPLDTETDRFLKRHHQVDLASDWYFQPFKSANSAKKWVRSDYSSSGLQAINTQTFLGAFIHERNTRIWGWASDYVTKLAAKLPSKKKIPAFDLAVWLYKDRDWDKSTQFKDIVSHFLEEYHITGVEKEMLFDLLIPKNKTIEQVFQESKPTWNELRVYLPAPPDSKPEQGGTLAYLETTGIGPAHHLIFEPAERLTIVTGDNGLGKTFLLECAWWALTGVWADKPLLPNFDNSKGAAEITFSIEGESSKPERKTIVFDRGSGWQRLKNRPTIPGLIVYARVDGSFAVWDPVRHVVSGYESSRNWSVFSSAQVWDGLPGQIEGLVRDWIKWQSSADKSLFETFTKVLSKLSPPDLGELKPGSPVRLPGDPRDIPTIQHPYGTTPILYSSAGVRRIITLAYLMVWAWNEHKIASDLAGEHPQRRLVVLIDEMEAHLHPRWQRSVLPALMSISEMLDNQLVAQSIVATHSPLVMASAEPIFDAAKDSLYHLNLLDTGEVTLREVDFIRFGDVSSWLTSPVFELRHARSNEAEAAIEAAKAMQLSADATPEEIRVMSESLTGLLAPDDKFWPRWIYFAEQAGVQL